MRCPTCHREMTLLFTSFACDYCDGLVDFSAFDRGWTVWRGDRGTPHYVFPTREEARRWQALKALHRYDICEVVCEHGFCWRSTRGTAKGLTVADRVYYVYPDHRFEPAPNRAFLRPGP